MTAKTYISCRKAKNVINELGLDPSAVGILELDEMGQEGAAIQAYLESETGQGTVPSIWIQKDFIGGERDNVTTSVELAYA